MLLRGLVVVDLERLGDLESLVFLFSSSVVDPACRGRSADRINIRILNRVPPHTPSSARTVATSYGSVAGLRMPPRLYWKLDRQPNPSVDDGLRPWKLLSVAFWVFHFRARIVELAFLTPKGFDVALATGVLSATHEGLLPRLHLLVSPLGCSRRSSHLALNASSCSKEKLPLTSSSVSHAERVPS